MAFNMTVMEYFGHGWDLATATGQPLPWSEAQSAGALALARAEATLPPEYRGRACPSGTRSMSPTPPPQPTVWPPSSAARPDDRSGTAP